MTNFPNKKSIADKAIPATRYLSDFAKEDGITRQAALYRSRRGSYVPVAVRNGMPKSRSADPLMVVWVRKEHLAGFNS